MSDDGRPLGMAMNPCLSACTSWPGSTLWPNTSTGSPHLDKSNFDNSFGKAVGLLLLVSCLWLNISTWLARSGRVQRKADVQLLWNPHQSSHPRLWRWNGGEKYIQVERYLSWKIFKLKDIYVNGYVCWKILEQACLSWTIFMSKDICVNRYMYVERYWKKHLIAPSMTVPTQPSALWTELFTFI